MAGRFGRVKSVKSGDESERERDREREFFFENQRDVWKGGNEKPMGEKRDELMRDELMRDKLMRGEKRLGSRMSAWFAGGQYVYIYITGRQSG